jgi:hypothetical protein
MSKILDQAEIDCAHLSCFLDLDTTKKCHTRNPRHEVSSSVLLESEATILGHHISFHSSTQHPLLESAQYSLLARETAWRVATILGDLRRSEGSVAMGSAKRTISCSFRNRSMKGEKRPGCSADEVEEVE